MNSKKKRYQSIQEFRSSHQEAESELLSEEPKKYDPDASTEELIADLRRVQEENPDVYITRRKYRRFGKYSDSTWDSRFGTFHEFRRHARLELSRGQSSLERNIAKHASLDTCKGFMEVEVLPWNGKYEKDPSGRWQTMIVASDFHDKDTDPFALEVFMDTCKRVSPSIICLAGDIFESYEFSRYDKDPRGWDAAGRLAWVRDNLFAPLRNVCPNAQIDLLAGNHEHHLLRHMSERTPEMRAILADFMGLTFADLLGLKQFEINLRCQHDLSIFKPGDLRKEIAKNRKTYFGCVTVDHYPDLKFSFGTSWVAGHTHKPQLLTHFNEILGSVWGVTNGCMSRIENSYTDRNRNQHSFTIIHIDTVNHCSIAEPVIFSDYGAVVGGVRYDRLGVPKTTV
jgi:predicted phosphodiesterase